MTQAIENPTPAQETTLAQRPKNPIKEKQEIVEKLGLQIKEMVSAAKIQIPSDYSPANALNAAWLTLLETVDKDKKPVLEVCSNASIHAALLRMITLGLNPIKTQCYFIAYGRTLTCEPSYFGDLLIAKRVRPGIEPYYKLIYEGDAVEILINDGISHVTHKQDFQNMNNKIIGAYCGFKDENGDNLGCEIMTIEQIKDSWKMSKNFKAVRDANRKIDTHHDFEGEMALRTVIRKRCKPIIKASSDRALLDNLVANEQTIIEAEMAEEVAANANGEVLDIEETPQALGASSESLDQVPTVTETQEEKAPAAASTGLSSEFD